MSDLEIDTGEGFLSIWDWGGGSIMVDVNCGAGEHAAVILTKEQAQKLADHLSCAMVSA
jgi:hypothetical protein